jgi:hypothetical protein
MQNNQSYQITEKFDLKQYKHDVFYVENFLTDEECQGMIDYFEYQEGQWGFIAFYGASGMGLQDQDPRMPQFGLAEDFIGKLRPRMLDMAQQAFDRPLRANTSHAQKWDVGGFANPHSDNSDHDGNPNAFEINKYVSLLYLNDDYEGGNLFFPDHDLTIRPKKAMVICFPGGHENVHGVSEITAGVRHTMMAFWDYAEAEYSEETQARWKDEIEGIRKQQELQQNEWKK